MTTNDCARVGLFLLGAYLIVSSLASATGLFSQQPMVFQGSEAKLDPIVIAIDLLGGALTVAVFGLAPGYVIISRSAEWADQWFPPGGDSPQPEYHSSALYAVGLTLLGIYLVVEGGAALLAGIASAASLSFSEIDVDLWEAISLGHAAHSFASGVVQLGAGILLWHFGRSYAFNAA